MRNVLVILDSNSLWADPTLQKSLSGRLLALSRRSLVSVAIPAVVLAELERQRRERLVSRVDQLHAIPRKANSALSELGTSAANLGIEIPDTSHVNVEDFVVKYRQEVREALTTNNVEVLPLPSVTHDELLKRDLAVRPPFDVNGRGYRDALIWASVLERWGSTGPDDVVYFVTDDHNFGKDEFSKELLSELADTGADFRHLVSLEQLLESRDLTEPVLQLQQALEQVGQASISAIAEGAVGSAVDHLLYDVEIDQETSMRLDIPTEIDMPQIQSASNLGDFAWSPYDEFNDTTVLGQGSIRVDVEISGEVEKANASVLAGDDVDVTGWDSGVASVIIHREATALFDVRVEVIGESVEDISFTGLEAV